MELRPDVFLAPYVRVTIAHGRIGVGSLYVFLGNSNRVSLCWAESVLFEIYHEALLSQPG